MCIYKPKAKDVSYYYPFAPKNNNDKTKVYPFNEQCIKIVVPDETTCGNYRIGYVSEDRFSPFYVGRVTEEKLKDRLIDHINEFGTEDIYFDFSSASCTLDAYKQECLDYHRFLDGEGYLKNKVHPAKPEGLITMCPVCGK